MVRVQALKEQIPEADQGVKEAVVEVLALESGQFGQGLVGQELNKEEQEMGWGERRLCLGFWNKGVFLDGM